MRVLRYAAVLAGLLSGSSFALSAQVLYGTVVGNVSDPSQGAVAGAAATISNKATGYTVESKTDERGAYDFLNVPPGTYDIKIVAAGFASFEAAGITVAPNNITRVDATLKVGNVSEVITVGAEVAQLPNRQVGPAHRYRLARVDADRRGRLPQFPVADRSRARIDAIGVSERLHRQPGARADDQRQRYGAQLEQHAHRRRG